MRFRVSVENLAEFEVGEDETIVEAASAQKVAFPFSCHSGTCGTCKSQLCSGKVRLLEYSKFALTDAERAAGLILGCCAIPESDCVLSLLPRSPIPSRKLTCRVSSIEDATQDIKVVSLQSDGVMPFLPGQYADLAFGSLPPRSYSMANAPGSDILEFHVRLSKGGLVSSYVHSKLSIGDRVELTGPLGTSYLRDKSQDPILLIAGGSGLAPIKSIVDFCVSSSVTREIHCYFGVRAEKDLYYTAHFESLMRNNLIRFVPVLSEPSEPTRLRQGLLCDVIATDFTSLSNFEVYAAGPPIMVDTCLTTVTALGVSSNKYFADAFV